MRRMYERGTKARFIFSGWSDAPINMADSMEEVNVGGEKRTKWHCRKVFSAVMRYISNATFLQVLRDFHCVYRHSPHYPPCLQERVTRQRS